MEEGKNHPLMRLWIRSSSWVTCFPQDLLRSQGYVNTVQCRYKWTTWALLQLWNTVKTLDWHLSQHDPGLTQFCSHYWEISPHKHHDVSYGHTTLSGNLRHLQTSLHCTMWVSSCISPESIIEGCGELISVTREFKGTSIKATSKDNMKIYMYPSVKEKREKGSQYYGEGKFTADFVTLQIDFNQTLMGANPMGVTEMFSSLLIRLHFWTQWGKGRFL